MILAGDIGATNARLAFFEAINGRLKLASEAVFLSRQYAGLEEILAEFLRNRAEPVDVACLGVAGPVRMGRAEPSNLPWVIESSRLARALKLPSMFLINDLEANAWGISDLEPEDLVTLNPGTHGAVGNQAVIAAGTGLGQAGIFWDGRQYHAFACEGGHADFAPHNQLQIELLEYLMKKFGRVSCERVLSGPGLLNIYHFLREKDANEEPKWLAEEMANLDPAAVVSKAALAGKCPICQQALDLFVSIYGAEAGNLALKMLATGGVYVAGGIAPKILPKLRTQMFMEAFVDKGRMRPLMEGIPVQVIVNENAGLLGAARCAAAQLAPKL